MQMKSKKFLLIGIVILLCVCMNIRVNAQTPADDPGIGGPGVGAAPAGDGSPIVPFDGGMCLILIASGVGYIIKTKKNILAAG